MKTIDIFKCKVKVKVELTLRETNDKFISGNNQHNRIEYKILSD